MLACMCGILSCVHLFGTPRTVAARLLCPWDFSQQEYWSGLPFPLSGNLSDPEIELMCPTSPVLEDGFVARLIRNPPTMQETWVLFLGWEDPLEKGMATHSSILAWRIPWTVYPWGHKKSETTERLSLSFSLLLSHLGPLVLSLIGASAGIKGLNCRARLRGFKLSLNA